MKNEFIKIYTKEELKQQGKKFLVERNLLLEDQLKNRIDREEKLQEVFGETLEMVKLMMNSFGVLSNEYRYEITENNDLKCRLYPDIERCNNILHKILDDNGIQYENRNEILSMEEYLKSEWLDGGQENEK